MKLTSGIVLSALTIAASSPTIAAAPFPGGNVQDAPNTPQMKSPDPNGDGALSPRARGIERFGGSVGPSGQRRSSVKGGPGAREKRDTTTYDRERRQLPSLNGLGLPTGALNGLGLPTGALNGLGLPAGTGGLNGLGLPLGNLGGLGLDQSTLAALEGQVTSGLPGLGLGGLTGTATGLAGNLAGTATGLAGNLAGTVSGVTNEATGLLNGLPVVGPVVGQVESATGLQGLLGGNQQQQQQGAGGQTQGLAGLASSIPIGSLQQALLAQAVQIQQLEKLVQSSLPVNLPNLPDASNLVNSASSTLKDPSLTNVANTANNAINSVNSATSQVAGAAVQAGNAASSAIPAPLAAPPLPSVAVPQVPSITGAFSQANQAANPGFQQSDPALGTASNTLKGIQAPVLPGPAAALSGLTGQLGAVSGVTSQLSGVAGQLPVVGGGASQLPPVGGVASQLQGAVGSATGQLGGAAGTVSGLAGTVNQGNSATQNWLPPVAQGALDPANNAYAQAQYAASQLQQNPLAFVPNTGKVLAAVSGTNPDQRITPAGAARTALDNNPAADSIPDTDSLNTPAVPATPQQAQDGENAATSEEASATEVVQSETSTIESQLWPSMNGQMSSASGAGAAPTSTFNPMTYLAPPLTADPTHDNGPTDIAFYTSAVPTTSAAPVAPSTSAPLTGSSDAAAAASSTASTPAPTATATKQRRQALPEPALPQAPALPSDDGTDVVADQSNSSLQPLAPQVAPYLQQYVNGYQEPASPADSFVSAWSVPLPSSALENLPTPPAATDSASIPATTFAAFIANDQPEVKAVAQKASPSPYSGWSQDTKYGNADDSDSAKASSSSASPTATKAKIHDPVLQALNTPPPIPARNKLRLARRQVANDATKAASDAVAEATGTKDKVFDAVGDIKINPNGQANDAGDQAGSAAASNSGGKSSSSSSKGPIGPPSNWSQDTDYSKDAHSDSKAALKDAGKKAKVATPQKAPAKASEILGKRQDVPAVPSPDSVTPHKHSSDNSSKKESHRSGSPSGRPAMTRQKAYDGKNPDHKHKKPKHSFSAPAPASTEDAPPADDAPEKMRMVRFARNRRDLEDLHQPPAGEHGEPAAAVAPSADVPSSDPPAYSEPAASSSSDSASAESTPTQKSKSGHKKGGKGAPAADKKHSGTKDKKKPKQTTASPSPSSSPEGESDADAAAPAKMRKRWMAKLSLKKWM